MEVNHDIPAFKAIVRRSHLTKDQKDANTYDNCYVFALQSVSGKILTFHIMTDYGMLRSRVPIHEIFHKEPTSDIPFDYKMLWDCFSYKVSVIEFSYLIDKRCEVILKDKTKVWATYLFTVDWYDNDYSEEPTDYKCAHVLRADDGYLLAQPNNRILWRDCNFITAKFPMPMQNLKVDRELLSVESQSDRWVAEDGESFYYEIKENKT
jgi:hypothetical protein